MITYGTICNQNCDLNNGKECIYNEGTKCTRHSSITYKICIICDKPSMNTVCDECKEAIKKLKEWLEERKNANR